MTRVAVVDVGSNSTRLLVCDVVGGRIAAVHDRRSHVTRLAEGVDASGELAPAAVARVHAVLDGFAPALERADVRVAVLTSAVRDARDGAELARVLRERHGLAARTLPGEEEARLSFLGAMSERDPADRTPTLVADVGGGSTELVVGAGREVRAAASLQLGVVRLTERHVRHDPPTDDELRAVAADARAILAAGRPRAAAERVIAVAGTPTSLAAIDLGLDPYDPDRAHGHVLPLARVAELRAELAALPLAERRGVRGLHPDRAPTIVAGAVILEEVLRVTGLDALEASEHDILRGAALAAAAGGEAPATAGRRPA